MLVLMNTALGIAEIERSCLMYSVFRLVTASVSDFEVTLKNLIVQGGQLTQVAWKKKILIYFTSTELTVSGILKYS